MIYKIPHVCRFLRKDSVHVAHPAYPGPRPMCSSTDVIRDSAVQWTESSLRDSVLFPSSGLLHCDVIQWHYKEPQLMTHWGCRRPGGTTPVTHLDKFKTVVQLDTWCSDFFAQLVLAAKWVSLFLRWVHTCNFTAYRNAVSWQCGRDSWPRKLLFLFFLHPLGTYDLWLS